MADNFDDNDPAKKLVDWLSKKLGGAEGFNLGDIFGGVAGNDNGFSGQAPAPASKPVVRRRPRGKSTEFTISGK